MPSKLQEPLPHFLACTRRMRGCASKHLNGSINFLPEPLILPCNIQGNPLSAENVPSKILSLALVACDIDRHTKSKLAFMHEDLHSIKQSTYSIQNSK